MKHSLLIDYPILPNDKTSVLVNLDNGVKTGAIYNAKPWKTRDDLQNSFSPVGIAIKQKCDIIDCNLNIVFSSKIISWESISD